MRRKQISEYRLPKVHFQTEIQHQSPSPLAIPLAEPSLPSANPNPPRKHQQLSSARTRPLSHSNFTQATLSRDHQIAQKRKKSKQALDNITKQQQIQKHKRLLSTIQQKYGQQFLSYRKKYYKPETVKEALQKILAHKSNLLEIDSMVLKEKCYEVVKGSIFCDVLGEFWKESFGGLVVVEEVFGGGQVNYDLAREIFVVEQKLGGLILGYKEEEIETVSEGIRRHSENIRYLKRKLMMVGGERVKTEMERFGGELDRGDVKGLIRGYRLEQENMIERINRGEKSMGRLIKNRLLLSEAEMISKRHEVLRERSVKTEG